MSWNFSVSKDLQGDEMARRLAHAQSTGTNQSFAEAYTCLCPIPKDWKLIEKTAIGFCKTSMKCTKALNYTDMKCDNWNLWRMRAISEISLFPPVEHELWRNNTVQLVAVVVFHQMQNDDLGSSMLNPVQIYHGWLVILLLSFVCWLIMYCIESCVIFSMFWIWWVFLLFKTLRVCFVTDFITGIVLC